ncbi:TadA family conjugal transfer-associated ATPase [Helcobacillus massiliensis]|uniref:Pilus assembly protein CpaF n=1 Tax=Helcobacillus massiliensis TaxID=521392 RepID=A0A839QZ24_9MICO|nr:TadA family conjugal transfer-associated ATPase [Helcobacillus massiliensis]MBB3023211.1 pilus assembly protein CpaF [Helcobacillus massiliensis]
MTDLLSLVHADLLAHPGEVDVARVARVLEENGQVRGPQSLLEVTAELRDHISGLGPLQPLAAPGVTDILVNADGTVWTDSPDGLKRADLRLGRDEARQLAVRLATIGGRRLDDAMPWADAQLPGGIRMHAVLPPLSAGGAVISLRLAAATPLSLDALEATGTLHPSARTLLERIIDRRCAFLISGGTGTGKTTLLSAMLARVGPEERIVIVEDASELEPNHPHTVHLQARHANAEGAGEVGLGMLVRQCLRMRPDRIVVGECRGEEIRELLQALNTGHEGGCGTLHANTAADVPARLEALGSLAGLTDRALSAQVLSAIDLVLHMRRDGAHRVLDSVAILCRGADGRLTSELAARFTGDNARFFPAFDQIEARLR